MKTRLQALIHKRLLNRRDELLGRMAWIDAGPPRGDELHEVENALRRLGNGTYGLCRCCGEPIAHGRLFSVPHTDCCTLCVPGAGAPDAPTTSSPPRYPAA